MLFCKHNQLGLSAPTPDQGTFREKSLGTSKASSKRSGVFGAKVLRIFKGLFQKPLKARFGTQFQLLTTIKKTRHCRVFLCSLSVGASPQTMTKGLFVKSPLESQKLHKNKAIILMSAFPSRKAKSEYTQKLRSFHSAPCQITRNTKTLIR